MPSWPEPEVNKIFRLGANEQNELYSAALKLESSGAFADRGGDGHRSGLAMLCVLLSGVFGPDFPSSLDNLVQQTAPIAFRDLATGDIAFFSRADSDDILIGCVLGYVSRHLIFVSPETGRAEIAELDEQLFGYRLCDCRRFLAIADPARSAAPRCGDGSGGDPVTAEAPPAILDLQERLNRGHITREEIRRRAEALSHPGEVDTPDERAEITRCPVCDSLLPAGAQLVSEPGFVACDYCIPYIERTS